MRPYYTFIAGLCTVSAILIVLQFTVSKGPAADQNKVDDLTTIDTSVQDYATAHDKLPTTLAVLKFSPKLNNQASSYDYTPSFDSYKICATFSTDQSGSDSSGDSTDPASHKSGRECFTKTVTITNRNLDSQSGSSSSSDSNFDLNSSNTSQN